MNELPTIEAMRARINHPSAPIFFVINSWETDSDPRFPGLVTSRSWREAVACEAEWIAGGFNVAGDSTDDSGEASEYDYWRHLARCARSAPLLSIDDVAWYRGGENLEVVPMIFADEDLADPETVEQILELLASRGRDDSDFSLAR